MIRRSGSGSVSIRGCNKLGRRCHKSATRYHKLVKMIGSRSIIGKRYHKLRGVIIRPLNVISWSKRLVLGVFCAGNVIS